MFKAKKIDVLLPVDVCESIEKKVRSYTFAIYEEARSNPGLALTLDYKIDIYKTRLVKEALLEIGDEIRNNRIYGCSQ